jgi:molecular chaperone GrpE
MSKEPGNHHKKDHKKATDGKEEKLFDFDKSFGDDPQGQEDGETNEKIASLESSLAELKEKNLRLLAEFDNYKKRTMRERLDLLNSASKDVIVALIPILDDFDRAKRHAEETDGEEFSEGVRLVHSRLHSTMQSLGLKEMDSMGQPFDPEYHDAITEVETPDANMKGKVIDVIEKGYLLNDKIIRHAKVVVGK